MTRFTIGAAARVAGDADKRRSAHALIDRVRRLGTVVGKYATPNRTFVVCAVVYLLFCALSFFVVRPSTLLYFTDYWEHRAILNEVARHGLRLTDPIYGEAASSRQYTPWSLALGYLVRFGLLDTDAAMAWGAMIVSIVFVAGVHRFARVYYADRWAPALMLVVLNCAWGSWPLIWTGFYAFRSQLHGNYYPAALVFAFTFVAWASALRLLRHHKTAVLDAVVLWGVVACSVITHPLNAAFLIAGAVGFAVLEPAIALSRRACVLLVIAAGIAVTTLWPYFNPLTLAGAGFAHGQATFNNFRFFYEPLFVIALIGPALFALPGLPGLYRDRHTRMPLLGLVSTFAAYVVGGIADISVSHRLLAYIVLMLHLLLVRIILDVLDGRPPRLLDRFTARSWRGLAIAGALFVLWQTAVALQQLTNPWANTHYPYPIHPVEAETSRVVASLPPGARILGWDSAALVMPSHGVLVASFPRPMPLSPTDAARQADYRRFFTSGVANCERRAIARRWGATHIAYLDNELDERVQRELAGFGPITSPIAPWALISVSEGRAIPC
ncbi:hypothetical protein [Sphingomonas asaccharolytica]|uniref:hypothetical protein n=1 Tax=Sphingomonas asaccharolytica TaxID=40681 RepID=UPI0008308062|nr:hypothetical protein [Sphingomonas asaccharolytica]